MTMEAHLSTGNTALAYCWIVVRRDGVTLGVTDHDEDVVVEGVTCSSASGITTTRFEQSLGLVSDDLEIEGVIDDDQFEEADIRAGLFDDAQVKLYLVNWQDPTEFLHMATGKFGQLVEMDGGAFIAEFLSRSHDLQQPTGRTYQRTCDTKLGSQACSVDLSLPAYRVETVVVSSSGSTVIVSALDGYDTGWFTLGKVITSSGEEIGVRRHSGEVLELWREPDTPVEVASAISVIAGCKQDIDTCRVKFDNVLNFQGFHLIPGNDTLTGYPVRGQDSYDGESLFL